MNKTPLDFSEEELNASIDSQRYSPVRRTPAPRAAGSTRDRGKARGQSQSSEEARTESNPTDINAGR